MESRSERNGLVAVITGGAGGIGRAVANCFSDNEDFKCIVLVDHGSRYGDMEELARVYNGRPGRGDFYCRAHDLAGGHTSANELVKEIINSYGRIDVLINTAGIAQEFGVLIKTDIEKARRVMEVNFWGTLCMCWAALPYMRTAGYGRIINIASIAAQRGDPGNMIYAASKAAIENLTKTLAREAPFNKDGPPFDIAVNAVSPGAIDTDMAKLLSDKVKEGYCRMNPRGRLGTPAEVAEVIYWLATGAPPYVNGEIIRVDGGFLA